MTAPGETILLLPAADRRDRRHPEATLVGILGTTISPYLFFWQAAQEVEEEISLGRSTVEQA